MAIPNTAIASKTATITAAVNAKLLAAAAKQSPLINPNQVQNQGTDGSSQGNKPRPGFEGPSPAIPEVSKPGYTPATADSQQATLNNALGLVSKTDAMKQLAGMGTSSTAAQSEKDKLTDLSGSSTTNQPSSDQGFGSQPNVDANTVPGGKPMAAFQGQGIGGVLEAAAASSQPASPPVSGGAAGSGMVSYDWDNFWGTKGRNGGDQTHPEDKISNDPEHRNKVTYDNDGTKHVFVKDSNGNYQEVGTIKGNTITPTEKNAGTPNPENTGGRDYILSQSILDQLNASKAGKPTSQGGSGDATPVDNGGIAQVVRNGSIAVNAASVQGQKLFGQPSGDAIGENVSGGNKGLDVFGKSNGAGVTNPGGEGGIPSGDPRFQQDPANALPGNKPAPTLQSPVGTQENQSSSVSTTLAAGARNLTLTGMAAINGSGNALDNVINGNSAANELRGEAGRDILDGKVGNDLLDGGAGRDQLTGGSGADRFRFATASVFGTAQADRITDFSRSEGDQIELSRSAFGLAAGATLSFQAVNSDAELTRALGSSSLLVQDLRDGLILFNQNGTAVGAGLGGVFAQVGNGVNLQTSDFALLA
jgi:Ca2+-binding RTX toxin-like protein